MWQVAGGRIIISEKKNISDPGPNFSLAMGLTWQEPLIPTEKETQKHGAPSVLYPKHWPGIRHKQQVTSHFQVSGNLFLGLKINK
jgi:hypothetical protein